MDLKCKGITWVGKICQKIESMCLDVEDIVHQETKFIERQVQTVGGNIVKFYEEVVQDLLPPSSIDLVEERASELLSDSNNFETSKIWEVVTEEDSRRRNPSNDESEVVTPLRKGSGQASCSTGANGEDPLPRQSYMSTIAQTNPESIEENDALITKMLKEDTEDDPMRDEEHVPSSQASCYTRAHCEDSLAHQSSMNPITGLGLDLSLAEVDGPLTKTSTAATKDDPARDKENARSSQASCSTRAHGEDSLPHQSSMDPIMGLNLDVSLGEVDVPKTNTPTAAAKDDPVRDNEHGPSSQASCSTRAHCEDNLFHLSAMNTIVGISLDLSLGDIDVPMTYTPTAATKADPIRVKEYAPSLSQVTTPKEGQIPVLRSQSNKVPLDSIFSGTYGADSNASLTQNNDLEIYKQLVVGIKEDDVNDKSLPSEASNVHVSHDKAYEPLRKMPPQFPITVIREPKSSLVSTTCDGVLDFTEGPSNVSRSLSSSEPLHAVGLTSSIGILPAEYNESSDDNTKLQEHNDDDETCLKSFKEFDNVNLGGSCILVDNRELFAASSSTGYHRSYKKKIRDAFASRLRSTKQREYEQLAILYADLDAEIKSEGIGSSILLSPTNDFNSTLSTHDSYESEWEIL